MNAVGYVRVSTLEQTIYGVSIEMQIEKIKTYCKLKDFKLLAIYGDPGVSGSEIKNRSGLQAILDLAKGKKIQAVVTFKLDRLARNTIETLEIANLFKKIGIQLHSVVEQIDTSGAIGSFFFRLLASLAEMERDIIAERTKAALLHKAKKQERVSRFAPIGYRFIGDIMKEDPREKEAIELAKKLKHEGYSLRSIANKLEYLGYVSRAGKTYTPSSIKAMVIKT